MKAPGLFHRRLKLCYSHSDRRALDSVRAHLDLALRSLGEYDLTPVTGPDDPARSPCDLLLVHAGSVPEADFPAWLTKFSERMERQGDIWIPAIFVAKVEWEILRDVAQKAIRMNWYFDVINPEHLSSLPVRIANLLRIHDHLHELNRYERSLNELSGRLEDLSLAVRRLRG